MLYNTIRSSIKSGDLLAWTHRGWGSWRDIKIQMVRFFTQSEYSHVGLAWNMGGRIFILEAVQPLVRIFPLSRSSDFYWIPMNANWNSEVEEAALSNVGDKYSQWDAIVSYFSLPTKDSKWECAEYVATILKLAGIDLGDKYTPAKLVNEALNKGNNINFVKL